MNKNIYDILRRPIITEKSSHQTEKLNQVVFEVAGYATKAMIKEAIETIFDVTVERVNVMVMPAKRKMAGVSRRSIQRRKKYKKAIITLAAGDTISIFEGVR